MPFLSHPYVSATPEMPLIPLDKRSGVVKENTAEGGRGGRSQAVQPGWDLVSICQVLHTHKLSQLGRGQECGAAIPCGGVQGSGCVLSA